MSYTEPLLAVCLAIALWGLLRPRRDARFRLALAGVLAIALVTWPPADWLLSCGLEARYPVLPFHVPPGPQAIVVLSAAVDPPTFERPFPELGGETFRRCEMALWLHKQAPTLPILTCGGKETDHWDSFAAVMRDYLVRSGVPQDLIWTEERSASTHENAEFGAEILRHHGIRQVVLVVDSQSMLRAELCFRKEGILVAPAPSTFRTFGPLSSEWLPSWKALQRNEATLHESVGLAWYWVHNWI